MNINGPLIKAMNHQELLNPSLPSVSQILFAGGVLDDVICAEDVDCVRTCERCGKLMDAGWVYEGIETYCSDDCLIASHPEIDIKELKTHAVEDNSNSYLTNWEK